MGRQRPSAPVHNIPGMVREELRRFGYAGRQSVPRKVFHAALGIVCQRLLEPAAGGAQGGLRSSPAGRRLDAT